MLAAVLHEHGGTPVVEDFAEPVAGEGQTILEVVAAGLNPVDLRMASGSFYGGNTAVPGVVGREGVGRATDGTGTLWYFAGAAAPWGSFAERAPVHTAGLIPVPAEVDPALATAFGIAGMAAWLALDWRGELQQGETVLVLGASGPVGLLAVQIARLLGAARVVAAARSDSGLARAQELGADAIVKLDGGNDLATRMRAACNGGADVIIDPVWGAPAAAALEATNTRGRLVQIGESAGATANISSASVRGKLVDIRGHTNFLAPPEVRSAAFARMAQHAISGELTLDIERVPLAEAPGAWERQRSSPYPKLVIMP